MLQTKKRRDLRSRSRQILFFAVYMLAYMPDAALLAAKTNMNST